MFDYFYGQSGEMFSYFRVPKILFRDIKFKDLSTDAKTLYFGKGDTGYAQYMTAFNRNFGGSSGGGGGGGNHNNNGGGGGDGSGCGCLIAIGVVVVLIRIVLGG